MFMSRREDQNNVIRGLVRLSLDAMQAEKEGGKFCLLLCLPH